MTIPSAQDDHPHGTQAHSVSVIMTVLNEEKHLAQAVAALQAQTWGGSMQIVVSLGPSTDRTDEVASQLSADDPRIATVANPTGKTPQGLNAAIGASTGDIIVRVDGHAILPPDYIAVAVETLERTGADNVGGVMAAEGETDFQSAVACAMTSPIGVGAASFHVGGQEGPAETVYLGVFRREILDRVGGYDPTFQRAQDWEMNHRIRQVGGVVWFNPAMQVTYRPRGKIKALAKQYFHYGRWRREMMRTHEGTASARYLAPPVAVSAILAGSTAAAISVLDPRLRPLAVGAAIPVGYALAVGAAGIIIGRDLSVRSRIQVPVALATMHMSWGWGFLASPNALRSVDDPS